MSKKKFTHLLFPGQLESVHCQNKEVTKACINTMHMLNCKINGTVHIFFLKSHISAPGAQNSRTFFSSAYFPLYLHVIIDLGHIWGPFMAKFDKMSKKKCFLGCPRFWVPPGSGCVCEQMLDMTTRFKFFLSSYTC